MPTATSERFPRDDVAFADPGIYECLERDDGLMRVHMGDVGTKGTARWEEMGKWNGS
jgi:hypothetical protein